MRKMKLVIALLIALSGFSYLLVNGFKESGIYYMKVGELLDSPEVQSKKIKLEGDVVDESIRKDSPQLKEAIEFEITDGENKLKVIYSGVSMPPAFKEGIPVVVEGRYKSEQKLFEASKLITKCPSKYEAK